MAGKVVISVRTASGTYGYVSYDYGATWAAYTPAFTTGYQFACFHFPWDDNDDEVIFYHFESVGTLAGNRLYRYEDGVFHDITQFSAYPPVAYDVLYPYFGRWSLETSVLNRQRLGSVQKRGGSGNWYLVVSDDAGDTRTTTELVYPICMDHIALSGDNPDVAYLWGGYRGDAYGHALQIGYTDDWFATGVQDKTGSLGHNVHLRAVGICGGLS
mgnify:CR=1 FL=1